MLKRHNITVIAGLSGVGKSYVVNKIVGISDRFIHFSAGSLIKKRLEVVDRDKLRLLSPNIVIQNQHVLIDQFNEELTTIKENSHIFFDAHMIIDTDTELIEIPFDIFEKLNPSRFILLHEDPKIILERRTKDTSRNRPQRSAEEILEQQTLSFKLAESYSKRLSIPIISSTTNDFNKLKKFILEKNQIDAPDRNAIIDKEASSNAQE